MSVIIANKTETDRRKKRGHYKSVRAMIVDRGVERSVRVNVTTGRCFLSVVHESGKTFTIAGKLIRHDAGYDFVPFADADKYWLKHTWDPRD
jgi:hypothetical protein